MGQGKTMQKHAQRVGCERRSWDSRQLKSGSLGDTVTSRHNRPTATREGGRRARGGGGRGRGERPLTKGGVGTWLPMNLEDVMRAALLGRYSAPPAMLALLRSNVQLSTVTAGKVTAANTHKPPPAAHGWASRKH
jgi:hypothetical protein